MREQPSSTINRSEAVLDQGQPLLLVHAHYYPGFIVLSNQDETLLSHFYG
jgi:hypothetical protein